MKQMARGERLIVAGLAILSLALRGLALVRFRFDSDEPQHLHVTWGWTAGLLQYRDLFDNHAPLFHMLTAPILSWVGERPDVLLYMRVPMLLLFAVVIASTWILGRRLYDDRVGIWAALLLSLFPTFFLKSVEYRNDNLWTASWCLALVALTGGPLTMMRTFIAGLLLGCAMAASLKTVLLLLTVAISGLVTVLFTAPGRSPGRMLRAALPMLAGTAIVPVGTAAYFYARGAWSNLLYCLIWFNESTTSGRLRRNIWLHRSAFVITLLLIVWVAWRTRRAVDSPPARWRFFLAFGSAFFSIALLGFWTLISPRDFLAILPIAAIFLAAAIDRIDARVPVYTGVALLFAGGVWYYAGQFRDRTEENISMMRQVLGLTRPDDPILDLKGETIYRRRPYYYILEFITRRALRRGWIQDTIPEDVVRAQCHVVQADVYFFPPRGRAFLRANFLDMGRLRAAGQWIRDDGSFTIAVPGQYVILNDKGEAHGSLDGAPYGGKRPLAPGSHVFVASDPGERLACLWAPAFERGYSPFHLRDIEFHGRRIFRAPHNDHRPPPGRRRNRHRGADAAAPGTRR